MSQEKIYIAIDFFHAASYYNGITANTNLEPDEDQHFYVVLQPFLISNISLEDPYNAGQMIGSPDLKVYLDTWNGQMLADGNHAALIRDKLSQKLNDEARRLRAQYPNNPEKWPVFTPVPFPPGTAQTFKLSWSNAGKPVGATSLINRTIDGAAPEPKQIFMTKATDWPEFAYRNYVVLPIRNYSHLNPRQQSDVLEWTVDLALVIWRKVNAGTPLEPKVEQKVFDDYLKAGNKEGDHDWWLDYLSKEPQVRVAKIFAFLWGAFSSGTLNSADPKFRHLMPPRFKYMPDDIRKRPAGELFDTIYNSYHESLWKTMAGLFKPGQDPERVKLEIRNAFGRLFGFGERLRWPWPKLDADRKELRKHFMIVGVDDGFGEDTENRKWLISNAHSLAGQVFRVGPIAKNAKVDHFEIDELTLQGVALLTEAEETPFEEAMLDLRSNVLALQSTTFASSVSRDNSDKPRVWYLPINAEAQRTGFVTPADTKLTGIPGAKPVLAVPGSLLDHTEEAKRVDLPPGDWPGWQSMHRPPQLLRLVPPRTLINPKPNAINPVPDLYGGMPDEDQSYQADIWKNYKALIQVKAMLERLPLAPLHGTEKAAYRLSLVGEIHPLDLAALLGCLKDLSAVAIWLPKIGGATGSVVAHGLSKLNAEYAVEAGRPVLTILDPKGDLTKLLPTVGEDKVPQQETVVDLICAVDGATYPFNWLVQYGAASDKAPNLVLREHFTHRVNFSIEQIVDHFKLSAQVGSLPLPPTPPHTEPVLRHFANFNKLRLWLQKKSNEATPVEADPDAISLNHPDALVPAEVVYPSLTPGDRDFPDFGYGVSHIFSEQVKDTALAAEDAHYRLYLSAGVPYKFAGRVEHQYGYQVAVKGKEIEQPGLSTGIRHMAVLDRSLREGATPELTKLFALRYDHRAGPKTAPLDESIQLSFNKRYFEEIYKEFRAGETGTPNPNPDQARPARLRELYEALRDLLSGDATLYLERWNFDNGLKIVDAAEAGDPEAAKTFPSITPYMKFIETATHLLDKNAELAAAAKLLGKSFTEFADNLRSALEKDTHPFWKEISLSLKSTDRKWTWSGSDGEARYPIYRTTDAVRLGLKIRRLLESTIAANSYEKAVFQPVTSEDQSGNVTTSLLPPLSPLADEARREFADFLKTPPPNTQEINVSPLHQSMDWVVSFDVDKKLLVNEQKARRGRSLRDPMLKFDEDRFDKLFGELVRYLNFPTELREAFPWVVDVYYVLYAFQPVLSHPAMGDQQTTFEFIGYLLSILNDIAEGHPISGVQVEGNVTVEEALRCQRLAQQYLVEGVKNSQGMQVEGIAPRLARVLQRVDNVDDILGNPTKLFSKVQNHVIKINEQKWFEKALVSLLSARPSLYLTNKAIALAIFSSGTFTERLHSLQVTKQIRREYDPTKSDVKYKDTDRFTFPKFLGGSLPDGPSTMPYRFFLDLLDDATYDNDFEIDQHTYKRVLGPEMPRPTSDLDTKKRGTTLARSAEDLIEQENYFEEAGDKLRDIEANVVHYNPRWQIKDEKTGAVVEWKYFLPSRKFPVIPKPVLPGGDDPWITLFIPSIPESGTIDLKKVFDKLMGNLPSTLELDLSNNVKLSAKAEAKTEARPPDIEDCGPWYHVESYLTHYFFIIEADEEGVFDNDRVEIQTEVSSQPFPATETSKTPQLPKPVSPLQNWFIYDRSQKEGKAEQQKEQEAPKPVTLDQILKELKVWFLTPEEGTPTTIPTGGADFNILRTPPSSMFLSKQNAFTRVQYYYDRGSKKWILDKKEQDPSAGGIGNVISVQRFNIKYIENGVPVDDPKRRLLRISVLDEPWKYSRVRVRVLRNVIDINRDDVVDMNPVFRMETPFSDWVNYGRHVLKMDSRTDFIESPYVARLVVEPGADKSVEFKTWVDAESGEYDFGPILERMINKTFTSTTGPKKFSLWNVKEAADKNRKLFGTVLQIIPDRHPRTTSTQEAATSEIEGREDEFAKQHLTPLSANNLGSLTGKIRKDLVKTGYPFLRVVWTSGSDRLLEIIWPIRWRDH